MQVFAVEYSLPYECSNIDAAFSEESSAIEYVERRSKEEPYGYFNIVTAVVDEFKG